MPCNILKSLYKNYFTYSQKYIEKKTTASLTENLLSHITLYFWKNMAVKVHSQ